jgi:hypothetical protein
MTTETNRELLELAARAYVPEHWPKHGLIIN